MNKQSESESSPEGEVDRRRNFRLIGLATVTILLVWFAVANSKSVSIDFWVTHSKAPLVVVIVISGLLGALLSLLARRRRTPRD